MLFSGCNSNSKTDLSQLLDEEEKIEDLEFSDIKYMSDSEIDKWLENDISSVNSIIRLYEKIGKNF
jgi:heterodisulfide reductase subunit A-like polyferredoxin